MRNTRTSPQCVFFFWDIINRVSNAFFEAVRLTNPTLYFINRPAPTFPSDRPSSSQCVMGQYNTLASLMCRLLPGTGRVSIPATPFTEEQRRRLDVAVTARTAHLVSKARQHHEFPSIGS